MTTSISRRALMAGIAGAGAANALATAATAGDEPAADAAGPKGVPPTIAMLARSPMVEHICLSPATKPRRRRPIRSSAWMR